MFSWSFLGVFFFFAGIGAILGIIYGIIRGLPLIIYGLSHFLRSILELLICLKDLGKAFIEGVKEEWQKGEIK